VETGYFFGLLIFYLVHLVGLIFCVLRISLFILRLQMNEWEEQGQEQIIAIIISLQLIYFKVAGASLANWPGAECTLFLPLLLELQAESESFVKPIIEPRGKG